MEIYFELTARLYGILKIIIYGLLYSRFITPFLHNKQAVRTAKIVYICTMSSLYLIPFVVHGIFAYALGTLTFFAVICLYDRRNLSVSGGVDKPWDFGSSKRTPVSGNDDFGACRESERISLFWLLFAE